MLCAPSLPPWGGTEDLGKEKTWRKCTARRYRHDTAASLGERPWPRYSGTPRAHGTPQRHNTIVIENRMESQGCTAAHRGGVARAIVDLGPRSSGALNLGTPSPRYSGRPKCFPAPRSSMAPWYQVWGTQRARNTHLHINSIIKKPLNGPGGPAAPRGGVARVVENFWSAESGESLGQTWRPISLKINFYQTKKSIYLVKRLA